jgi:hypothetical protein
MFRLTRKPLSGSHSQYLAKITHLVQCGYIEVVQTSVLWLRSMTCDTCVLCTVWATCVSGCGVCTECRGACCTALSTPTTTWNTCSHNTAKLITMYFYWLILQKCNFRQSQRKLPENGPDGPKHVEARIRYFNCKFLHFICLIKAAFVGKKEF